jgi:hypothetical protein
MPAERQRKQRAPRLKRRCIPGYTGEAETAEELNVSTRTLRKWRQLRIGPAWVQIARAYYYSDAGRSEWIKSRVVYPEREAAMSSPAA